MLKLKEGACICGDDAWKKIGAAVSGRIVRTGGIGARRSAL
jgi:hypothetical protein